MEEIGNYYVLTNGLEDTSALLEGLCSSVKKLSRNDFFSDTSIGALMRHLKTNYREYLYKNVYEVNEISIERLLLIAALKDDFLLIIKNPNNNQLVDYLSNWVDCLNYVEKDLWSPRNQLEEIGDEPACDFDLPEELFELTGAHEVIADAQNEILKYIIFIGEFICEKFIVYSKN